MKKYRCYCAVVYLGSLFCLFLIVTTLSPLLSVDGVPKYNYYRLSQGGNELVIRIDKRHLKLDCTLLLESFQITATPISETEAALISEYFTVTGGVMTSPGDGSQAQRRRIETESLVDILRSGSRLYASGLNSWGTQTAQPDTLEVDFAFQLTGELEPMKAYVNDALSALICRNVISSYTIRYIISRLGRRGSMVIGVVTSLPQQQLAVELSKEFAGFFYLSDRRLFSQ